MVVKMRIPNNFVVRSRFELRGLRLRILLILSLFIGVLFFKLFSILGNFNLLLFIAKFNSPLMLVTLAMALLFFIYVHGYVHEKIHQYFFRIYGIRTEIHMNFITPNNTLPIGEACVRNGALYATLSPLVVLEVFGFMLFVLIRESDFLAYAIMFLSANIAMASADLAQSVWIGRHPKEYLFGFDGKDSIMYGPQPASKSNR